jgi:hypothetical protein
MSPPQHRLRAPPALVRGPTLIFAGRLHTAKHPTHDTLPEEEQWKLSVWMPRAPGDVRVVEVEALSTPRLQDTGGFVTDQVSCALCGRLPALTHRALFTSLQTPVG